MSDPTLLSPPTESPGERASERIPQSLERGPTLSRDWLQERLGWIAAAIVIAGFALRIYFASKTCLNPDEALHYLIINQPNIWLAYKASLTNAHPPLIYFVLYVWRFLGCSELMLRMPSVLAGTAACWLGFKWVETAFGKVAGLIALVFLGFSPGMVVLSAELRAYALLLACMTAALYLLTQAFEKKSAGRMWIFSAFLYLSILSHYSAIFFTVAVGVYALARFADSRLPRNVMVAWAAGQAGALMLCGFLYVTHVSKIKSNIAVWAAGFGTAYFHSADGDIFTFTGTNTVNVFQFLFGQKTTAWILLLCFIAGIGLLFRKELLARRRTSSVEHLGILLLFPFLAVWGAALVGTYPYVGSRHTAFLAPFAIAGASYSMSLISRQRLWAGLVIAVALMGLAQTGEKSAELNISSGDNSRQEMAEAIRYMQAAIPRGDLILVDYQSSLPMTYYFCGPKTIIPYNIYAGDYSEFRCNGNPIISLHIWKAAMPGFPKLFEDMARSHALKPGDRVWFYQAGWGDPLDAKLDRHSLQFRCLAPQHFGTGVLVIPFVIGPDFQPTAPTTPCPA